MTKEKKHRKSYADHYHGKSSASSYNLVKDGSIIPYLSTSKPGQIPSNFPKWLRAVKHYVLQVYPFHALILLKESAYPTVVKRQEPKLHVNYANLPEGAKKEAETLYAQRSKRYIGFMEKLLEQRTALVGFLLESLSEKSRSAVESHPQFSTCYDTEADIYRPDRLTSLVTLTHQSGSAEEVTDKDEVVRALKISLLTMKQGKAEELLAYYKRTDDLHDRDQSTAALVSLQEVTSDSEYAQLLTKGLSQSHEFVREKYHDQKGLSNFKASSLEEAYKFARKCCEAKRTAASVVGEEYTSKASLLNALKDFSTKSGGDNDATVLLSKVFSKSKSKGKGKDVSKDSSKGKDKAESGGPSRPCKYCTDAGHSKATSMHWDSDCPAFKAVQASLQKKKGGFKRKARVFEDSDEDESEGSLDSDEEEKPAQQPSKRAKGKKG